MDKRYTKHVGCVYSTKYHIVWCPKYRKSILLDEIAQRCSELICDKAQQHEWAVESIAVMPDHVHVFISATPMDAPQYIANQLKGYTSRRLMQEFPSIRKKLPTLWSRSYFINTVGSVSSKAIEHYIEAQKGR
jgi:putative transposase